MVQKLFIGNLSWGTTDESLRALFETIGAVEDAVVIKDKFSGRSKGFGFVTFVSAEDAGKAIAELDGKELDGRAIAVKEALPPKPRD